MKTAANNARVKEALDDARTAARELHGALSDAAAKCGGAIKSDIEAITLKAKAIADSPRNSLGAQSAATKKYLSEAVRYLEATGAHAAEAVKSSGHAAERSIQQAITDARASVQKISEAVAAKRSAGSTLTLKKQERRTRHGRGPSR